MCGKCTASNGPGGRPGRRATLPPPIVSDGYGLSGWTKTDGPQKPPAAPPTVTVTLASLGVNLEHGLCGAGRQQSSFDEYEGRVSDSDLASAIQALNI